MVGTKICQEERLLKKYYAIRHLQLLAIPGMIDDSVGLH